MKDIPFVKMHGLGNDFVFMEKKYLSKIRNISDFASKVSNRRRGIGCDQFITYSNSRESDIEMSIYNQDGSKALACGNASRCLARLMFDKNGYNQTTLNIDSRIVQCNYLNKDEIKVNMGEVSFDEPWMPKQTDLWELAKRHLIEPKEMICVDVANPHLVIFTKLSDQDKKVIGQNFQNNDLFKDGINVNFATIEDSKIYLKVWERGAGFTYACGSGAIATFAAANKLGFASDKVEVLFELGSLLMQKEKQNINMIGSATYIYSGSYTYE